MDKLDELFTMQTSLNNYIINQRNLQWVTNEEWLQKHTIALVTELGEMLQETNFKWWKNPKVTSSTAIQEELVDMLHFFISMCIASGMTAEDMFRLYLDKNEENYKRQQGLSKKEGYKIGE